MALSNKKTGRFSFNVWLYASISYLFSTLFWMRIILVYFFSCLQLEITKFADSIIKSRILSLLKLLRRHIHCCCIVTRIWQIRYGHKGILICFASHSVMAVQYPMKIPSMLDTWHLILGHLLTFKLINDWFIHSRYRQRLLSCEGRVWTKVYMGRRSW